MMSLLERIAATEYVDHLLAVFGGKPYTGG